MRKKSLLVVNMRELLVMILLIASIQLNSLEYILPSIATIFNVWMPVAVMIGCLFLFLLKRAKISEVTIYISIYFGIMLLATFLTKPSNVSHLFAQIAPVLAVTYITEYFMRRSPDAYIRGAMKLLVALIIIDLVTIFLFPNGMYETTSYVDNWFLGYKTARVRLATMPVVMFAAVYSLRKKNKLDIKYWAISLLAILDTFLSKNTGGVVCILGFNLILWFVYFSKNEKIREKALKLLNFRLIVIIILIITIIVNVAQNLSLFDFFTSNSGEKAVSLWARTRIWSVCLDLFSKSPFWGNGYVTSDVFIELAGFPEATQPHSLLMAILVYTGIIGALVFFFIVNRVLSYGKNNSLTSGSVVCKAYIICFLLQGIISMHLFAQFFYAGFIMAYYLPKMDEGHFKLQNSNLTKRL